MNNLEYKKCPTEIMVVEKNEDVSLSLQKLIEEKETEKIFIVKRKNYLT